MCSLYDATSFNPLYTLLLLCSHSPNDVPPEPKRNISIAAVRRAVRPSNPLYTVDSSTVYILDESIYHFRGAGSILSLLFYFDRKSCKQTM